jgi:hypothetical protein
VGISRVGSWNTPADTKPRRPDPPPHLQYLGAFWTSSASIGVEPPGLPQHSTRRINTA